MSSDLFKYLLIFKKLNKRFKIKKKLIENKFILFFDGISLNIIFFMSPKYIIFKNIKKFNNNKCKMKILNRYKNYILIYINNKDCIIINNGNCQIINIIDFNLNFIKINFYKIKYHLYGFTNINNTKKIYKIIKYYDSKYYLKKCINFILLKNKDPKVKEEYRNNLIIPDSSVNILMINNSEIEIIKKIKNNKIQSIIIDNKLGSVINFYYDYYNVLNKVELIILLIEEIYKLVKKKIKVEMILELNWNYFILFKDGTVIYIFYNSEEFLIKKIKLNFNSIIKVKFINAKISILFDDLKLLIIYKNLDLYEINMSYINNFIYNLDYTFDINIINNDFIVFDYNNIYKIIYELKDDKFYKIYIKENQKIWNINNFFNYFLIERENFFLIYNKILKNYFTIKKQIFKLSKLYKINYVLIGTIDNYNFNLNPINNEKNDEIIIKKVNNYLLFIINKKQFIFDKKNKVFLKRKKKNWIFIGTKILFKKELCIFYNNCTFYTFIIKNKKIFIYNIIESTYLDELIIKPKNKEISNNQINKIRYDSFFNINTIIN